MKNLYMVQPNSQYGDSIYFPYAVGSLVAYAFTDKDIKNAYRFCGFFYKKEPIEFQLSKIKEPDVIGFSCYVWNYEYNKFFAKEIKKKWPSCQIVFGGHQINAQSDVLQEDYVDVCLLGEGEESFKRYLKYFIGLESLEKIPNMIYKKNGLICQTEKELVQIPHRVSPYTEGCFNELVEKEKLSFSAILETNRGCPNKCAFCDWGNIKAKVKMYDLELVKQEIDWMSEHKIEYCYSADANFGLFSRDNEIIDYIIQKNKLTGYPRKFQATYSKNNPDTVFSINKRLNEAGMSKGATLSFQSMDQQVLMNIGRKNMPLSSFQRLMELYNAEGIPSYSEIILGMPGETYQTLKTGIETLLESGQHMAINFFNCELLNNSIMNTPSYLERFQIKTARTQQHQYHVRPEKNAIQEYSNIIISTRDMDSNMWIDCNILTVFVRTLHNLGLLQCFAILLFFERHIPYMEFYENIISFAKENPNTVIGGIYYWLKKKYTEVTKSKGSLTCLVPEFGSLIWPMEEGAFLKIILEYERFYQEITPLIQSYFSDSMLFEELMEYQKAVVKTPYSKGKTLEQNHDFFSYFLSAYQNHPKKLKLKSTKIYLDASDVPSELHDFAKETIWYGRKGGKNIITDISYL